MFKCKKITKFIRTNHQTENIRHFSCFSRPCHVTRAPINTNNLLTCSDWGFHELRSSPAFLAAPTPSPTAMRRRGGRRRRSPPPLPSPPSEPTTLRRPVVVVSGAGEPRPSPARLLRFRRRRGGGYSEDHRAGRSVV